MQKNFKKKINKKADLKKFKLGTEQQKTTHLCKSA